MVMGESAADVWTDELRRNGRVVFPVRRRPVVLMFGLWGLMFVVNPAVSLAGSLDDGTGEVIIQLLGLIAGLVGVGFFVWLLVTQRPLLVVDHEGIRYGRKWFIPWCGIGTIGAPHGPKSFMQLPILPTDIWAKQLVLSQGNVRDVPAFAAWLEQLLAEHRSATT